MASLLDFTQKFNTDEKCFKYFMKVKYDNRLYCPYCSQEPQTDKRRKPPVMKRIKRTRIATVRELDWTFIKEKRVPIAGNKAYMYQCTKCKKQISPLRGTVFSKTKIPLQKWFLAIHVIVSWKKGFASLQLYREIDVNYKTALRMLHLIRKMMVDDLPTLRGTIEIDEAYISNSKKSKYNANPTKQWRSKENKSIVIWLYSRNQKKIIIKAVASVDEKTILKILKDHVAVGSRVMTDEWTGYGNIRLHGYIHWVTNHNKWEYAKWIDIHSNMPEYFWSLLMWWLWTVYQWVTKEYLENYLNEYSWRFNYKSEVKTLFERILLRV